MHVCKIKYPLISINATTGRDITMNRAKKAEQILISTEKRYKEEKDYRVMPDCISYSIAINAYANNNAEESRIHTDAILCRMINWYLSGDTKCRPNAMAFTAAIRAHFTAINAALLAKEGELATKDDNVQRKQTEASARQCKDLLQQLCLMCQNQGMIAH